jgi:predicted DsbA family dithiol-disulfide isomerase
MGRIVSIHGSTTIAVTMGFAYLLRRRRDGMQLEIWSDIMCPFCYMGKRNLEAALGRFPHAHEVQVLWRSYQLDPGLAPSPGTSIHEYLAKRKGMSRDWSVRVHAQVEKAAADVGLVYNFDTVVPANSFDAHRLAHLAHARGLQGLVQERLFAAYFTEGRDLGDKRTLIALGAEAGLVAAETEAMLAEGTFADEVRQDCREADALGAEGVPFFVIDRRYGFTGAQPSAQVLDFLTRAWSGQLEEERAHG